MQIDEALEFWKFKYNITKDYNDIHWEASERREHEEYVEALKTAIEALEKQMPKKPVIKFGEKPVTHNYGRLMQFFCPGCGRHIIAMYETDVLRGGGISNDVKGCYSCLQRIDFSGYYHKGGENNAGMAENAGNDN
jgi:hypothetical protein